ncbi:MAG: hypothetical protein Q9212_005739 [Teloschistes hypoglaucus]
MAPDSSTTQLLLVSLLQKQHPPRFTQLTPSDIQAFFTHWYPDLDLWTWIADRFSVEDINLTWQKQMGPRSSSLPDDVMQHIVREQKQKQKQKRKAITIKNEGQAGWGHQENVRRDVRELDINRLEIKVKERLKLERKWRR